MNTVLYKAINASILAGKAIMEVYEGDHKVQSKLDESPLTQADINANKVINAILKSTDIPIISEENRQVEYTERKEWRTCWVVDPLDGTKEFIKRNGEFTVNIALVKDGRPMLGVIFVPVSKTLYFTGSDGASSFKMELSTFDELSEQALLNAKRIGPAKEKNNVIRIVGSRSHMNDETRNYLKTIEATGSAIEIVSIGSSLKFCLVAEGKADVYPRFAPTMEWDTAAGQAICEAVGVNVISLDTNASLRYNKENLLNSFFLVTSS